MTKKKLRSDHPLAGMTNPELMADATAQAQLETMVAKAMAAADKSKNRAKSLYGKRAVSILTLDLQACLKRLRAWDDKLQEAL